MADPLSMACLPPIASAMTVDCNRHVRILLLSPQTPATAAADEADSDEGGQMDTSALWVITVGHPRDDLLMPNVAPHLPSPLVALATATTGIALPSPWTSFNRSGTSYLEQYQAKSGVSGTSNSGNTSLRGTFLPEGAVAPLRLQDENAIGSNVALSVTPGARPLANLSRRLLAFAAHLVDPALARPVGGTTTALAGPPLVELVQHLSGLPAPLYIGADSTRLTAISDGRASKWDTEADLVTRLISGPGVIANAILQAALDEQHRESGGGPEHRQEMQWVKGGGESLAHGGTEPGQPDFALRHREGPSEPWTILITAEAKIFMASPLLAALLQTLESQGSATLASPGSTSTRPAWDRLITQMAEQVARTGARCAVVWNGLDMLVLQREMNETFPVAFRVWPKLLRAVWMRNPARLETGDRADTGTTRHNISSQPRADQEEADLNEAGLLITFALHAHRLRAQTYGLFHLARRRGQRNLQPLTQLLQVGPELPHVPQDVSQLDSEMSHHDELGGEPMSEQAVFYDEAAIGSGAYATVHRARLEPKDGSYGPTSQLMPYVAKLPRDRPPPDEEDWGWWPEKGPESFAAEARGYLALEAAAYLQAADLQGSVLPVVMGTLPVEDPVLNEGCGGDSGELSLPSLSTTSIAPTSSLSEPEEMPIALSPTSALQLDEAAVRSSDDDKAMTAMPAAQPARPNRPPAVTSKKANALIDAIIMTFAGHSLRDLVAAGQSSQPSRGASPPPCSLRRLLAEAGLTDESQAASWLSTELLQALRALHSRGVAHGDVSAANVCIQAPSPASPSSLRLCLIDLGKAALQRGSNDEFFAATATRDLAKAQDVVQWAVSEAWSTSEESSELGGSTSESESRTPTPMPSNSPVSNEAI